jgi:hypothetical protein
MYEVLGQEQCTITLSIETFDIGSNSVSQVGKIGSRRGSTLYYQFFVK